MKRILLILLITILVPSCQADDSWDDFSVLDHAWDGQKSITNKEFEEAINTLEEKQTKKEAKQRKKLIKKIGGGGTSLHPDLNPESDIKNLDPLKKEDDDGVLLNIPVNLVIDDVPMDKGFYKVIAEKDKNNDINLLFYQSQFFKGKVRACETSDDYDQDSINFVKLLPYNEQFVKIIFGSLDFNAYAYVKYVQ